MALQVIRRILQPERVMHGGLRAAAQRRYLKLMFGLITELLVAGSQFDEEIQAEVTGFPEGLTIGFSVLGSDARLRVRVRNGRFEREPQDTRPVLDILFKHLSHAFMVFSFQESTPMAFANQRTVVNGDTALAMRFVRCLNRVQAVALPEAVARRALKAVPEIGLAEKLSINARLYADMVRRRTDRSEP